MERSQVILISSIAGAAVLILGGAAFFLMGGEDTSKPTWDPSRPKPKPLVVKTYDPNAAEETTAAAGGTDTPTEYSADAPWFTLSNEDLNYRLSFPAAPTSFNPQTDIKSASGRTDFSNAFSESTGERAALGGMTYSLTVGVLANSEENSEEQLAAYADNLPTIYGYLVEGQGDLLFGDKTGKELLLASGTKRRLQRLFVANGKLYAPSVEATGEINVDDPQVAGFFDSLMMTQPPSEEGDDLSADEDWVPVQGSLVGFRALFPTDGVQQVDVLQTMRNAMMRTQLITKWQEQRVQHESWILEVGNRTYSVTAFLDNNRRAPEFSRINNQNGRMEALLKSWYGVDATKAALQVSAPPAGTLVSEDSLLTTDSGRTVIARRVLAGLTCFMLRVEGPAGLYTNDENVTKFLSSIQVSDANADALSAMSTEIDQAVVLRYHPHSGLDVELPDGKVLSFKPTADTRLLDPDGGDYPAQDNLLANVVLLPGNTVSLKVNSQKQPNMQRTVREIQVLQLGFNP